MIGTIDLSRVANRYDWQYDASPVDIGNVSIDSRNIVGENCLFVALKGERFDGYNFISQAVANGAAAVLAERHINTKVPVGLVPNAWQALGQLGATNRARMSGPLIALTGSAGKTTVKSLIFHILSGYEHTLATKGNLNNEIGVPLTLLSIDEEHRFAVVEMGAGRQGDIAYLCEFAKPDIALVTLAAEAHLDGFGDLDGVAKGKGEIFESLNDGVAVINRDADYYPLWCEMAGSNSRISFGLYKDADVRADKIVGDLSGSDFVLSFDGLAISVRLAIPGIHNVMNALAATACCLAAGLRLDQIAEGLSEFCGVDGRMASVAGIHGGSVIDDSYNANPRAFKAAIDVLVKAPQRKILVMGDMGELGNVAEAAHDEVGHYALDAGVDKLFTFGELSQRAAKAFGSNARVFAEKSDLINELKTTLGATDTVLVKGSRFTGMDEVVRAITADSSSDNNKKRESLC